MGSIDPLLISPLARGRTSLLTQALNVTARSIMVAGGATSRLKPEFGGTPGAVEHAGLSLGQHNTRVCRDWFGYNLEEIDNLNTRGVI